MKEETKEPEFQPGEMVEVSDDEIFTKRTYRFFAEGKHWVASDMKTEVLVTYDHIRKIQPDPEKKYRDAAQAIMRKENMDNLGEFMPVEILSGTIESMLIEALKTEVK